jgi:hypothetical protein
VIQLRGGRVASGDPARWILTRHDSVSVAFGAATGQSNGFTWTYREPGAWTARLTWDSAGVPREQIYEMRAVPQ